MSMGETIRLRVAGFLGVGPGLVEVGILDILQDSVYIYTTQYPTGCAVPEGPTGTAPSRNVGGSR